ncbi:MAG: redoxin domain-containing protein [Verrucomicrobiota bacterium]
MAINVGDPAPNFTLFTKDASGMKEVTLSDYRGEKNVVLLFFPLAFTSVCMAEVCTIRDSLNSYSSLNAQVFGISVDSPFTLEVMAEKESLNFPLLSDFNKEVASAYGCLFESLKGLKGVAKRSAFVVGTDGLIKYAAVSDDPGQMPDFDAIKSALSA